jgi:hypothetical protein
MSVVIFIFSAAWVDIVSVIAEASPNRRLVAILIGVAFVHGTSEVM